MKTSLIAAALAALVLLPLPVRAEISLEQYCKDGYYQIPGEKKCSRAPNCGGKGYDELNKAELMPDHNDCLDEGRGMVIGNPPNSSAFYGYVPLCCYEMARTGDPLKCIGYWERLWCHPDQCKAIDNDHGCGGGACQCAHAMKGWCETRKCNMLPPVPLEVRLGLKKPTPTVPPPPTAPPYIPPTRPPAPTAAAPTRPPYIPPQQAASPPPVRPPATAAPVRLPTAPPPPPIIVTDYPKASKPLPDLAVKSTLRKAVIGVDPGLRQAETLFTLIVRADRNLENFINTAISSLFSHFKSKRSGP